MLDARPRRPTNPTKNPKPRALFCRVQCPSCGRDQAIVFRQIREHDESVKDAPLVCLDCCLEVRGRSWPAG